MLCILLVSGTPVLGQEPYTVDTEASLATGAVFDAEISAVSAILIEANSGNVIFEKDSFISAAFFASPLCAVETASQLLIIANYQSCSKATHHFPLVKSGISTGALPRSIDLSERGVMDIHAAIS